MPADGVVIDVVMPARNEALTVAANVAAARGCRYARRVIVVDDGSTDCTAEAAAAAGAEVVRRPASTGSKAHAMAAGLEATDAPTILFVDADCTGLTSAHLEEICEPYVAGRATMSIGAFDYGPLLNWWILRWVPLSGERVIPRWVFEAIPPHKLDGYTIESRINEVIAEGRLRTVVRTMRGVSHRTKRDKFGPVEGAKATWAMFVTLIRLLRGDIRWRAYWYYLQGLTVEPSRTPPAASSVL